MKIKLSQYNNRVNIEGKIYYFNSLTNAIIELDNTSSESKMLHEIATYNKKNILPGNKFLDLGFIVDNEIKEDQIVEYYYQRNKFDSSFLGLELFPSYICNLSCDFCTLKNLRSSYDTDNYNSSLVETYYDNVSRYINSQPITKIIASVFGGEPLINYKQILKFIDQINNNKKLLLTIVTNGMLLNEMMINEMVSYDELTRFQFTIDGLPKYHNKVKGSRKSFSNTINGINKLITSQYKGSISIRINISEKNITSLNELMKLLSSIIIGFDELSYYPAFINNANNVVDDNYCVKKKKTQEILAEFYDICKSYSLKFQLTMTPLLQNCSYLRENAYVIAPDLQVYKCNDEQTQQQNSVGKISRGKLKLNSFANKGRIKQFNILSTSYLTDKKCRICSWLPVCRMGCPLGDKPDYCKEIMNSKLINYIKYYYH